jgi:hypothetical protein
MLCLIDAISSETNKPIGFVIDLSFGGFCLLSKTSLLPGTRHAVQLRLNIGDEDARCAKVVAECRWNRRSRDPNYNKAGFSFVSIGGDGEDLVRDALRLVSDGDPEPS